ncbi:MAG: DEAD/DEAH box helicase [Myxococcales bacterium]|nr:DEAD/DEAH box helicase [Myxococcales bacterium]
MSPEPTASTEDAPDAEPHVPTGADYASDRRFADFPISPEVLQGITELGYVTATPVQDATIDLALAGRDLLVRAKTGTGKTAAFCVPIVERTPEAARKPHALVLAPTRELAQQIGDEFDGISKFKDINVAVLVGGLAMGPQEQQLQRGSEIVVGTPGRILDHLRRKTLDLSECRVVCLDEADEMLSMGFYEDVTTLLDATHAERQVLLFSATISDETQRLADRYLKSHEDIRLSTDADNVDTINHVVYETTPGMHKIRALLYLLDMEDPTSAIIFCNTREDTATVASFLDRQGLDVQLLSGELSQGRRSQVMAKVKAGEVRFLVSTDVAARGIDISDLSHVINYSLPQDAAVYLHRTGRTGRIGKQGTAISLVGGTDLSTRKTLETRHGLKFEERHLPDADAAVGFRVERQARQIREAMGSLVFEAYLPTVKALKERPDGDALLAAALRAFFQWDRSRRAAMSGVDSVADLIQQRNEKIERREQQRSGGRKGRERDRDRDRDRDRKDRGDRKPRQERAEKPASADDLDALLVADGPAPAASPAPDAEISAESADAGARKKKRRRRKRKGADDAESSSSEEGRDDGAGNDTGGGMDDLDALLTAE